MQQNERTYRQLHPRVIDARPRSERLHSALVIGLGITAWLLTLTLFVLYVFVLRNPCALCVR